MIQDGHPRYTKRYSTTLSGVLRKEFELYRSARSLRESIAVSILVERGLKYETEQARLNEAARKADRDKLK